MDELQQAIQGEKNKKKKMQKPQVVEEEQPQEKGMDLEAMKNFMEGNGELPSEEAEPTAQFIWDIDSEVEPQEVSFSVNGQEMTDPAEIRDWVNSNIVEGPSQESATAEMEEEMGEE